MMSEDSKCPYCGADVPSDYDPVQDDELKCHGCGKTYKIKVRPRIYFKPWKKETREA